MISLAAFVVVVAGMRAAESIIVPFLLSVFIAVISAPMLFWLTKKGLPTWLALLIVIGGVIGVITGIVGLAYGVWDRYPRRAIG